MEFHLDDELHRRLGRRFGASVESWLDALPPILNELAEGWELELESLIQRGTVSVVIRCRTADGAPAVLKVSPDRRRIAAEAAALARWKTAHVPAALAFDQTVGALLIEAIEPGTALDESDGYPGVDRIASLITALHRHGIPDPSYQSVAERVAYLFDAGRANYQRQPELADVVPSERYEQGRELALQLAADVPTTVLLHGDLTPVNILDGGSRRGLVAIDPAPCLGDPAFDAVDLVFWHEPVDEHARQLAAALGAEPARLLAWCRAFAPMVELERAESELS